MKCWNWKKLKDEYLKLRFFLNLNIYYKNKNKIINYKWNFSKKNTPL
jgi:hypothetical protein